jgi:D-beta-D-heptose 7-phosphate kinase / D-beta-D-heptose 1-phosphate adenosyltransferase
VGEVIDLGRAENLAKKNRRVLVGGCFDIIHLGHVEFLNKAKEMGDELWVMLESDVTVKKLKGENRPINSQQDRAEVLINLRAVDYVVMLSEMKTGENYDEVLKILRPDIIAATEGDQIKDRKTIQAKMVEAELRVIPNIEGKSTSKIIELLI